MVVSTSVRKIARGSVRLGSRTSSAMLTRPSKPRKANTASKVALAMPANGHGIGERRHRLGQARDEIGAGPGTRPDQQHQPAHLDHGHDAGKDHGLLDAPGGDGAHGQHHQADAHRLGQGEEHADIAGAADADGGRRDHGNGDHQGAHQGGQAVRLEGRAHVGGLPGGDRHAPGQLGKRGRRQAHQDGSDHEGQRGIHAGARGSRPDQDVDAGADGDAEAIEHRIGQRERALQGGSPRRGRRRGCPAATGSWLVPPLMGPGSGLCVACALDDLSQPGRSPVDPRQAREPYTQSIPREMCNGDGAAGPARLCTQFRTALPRGPTNPARSIHPELRTIRYLGPHGEKVLPDVGGIQMISASRRNSRTQRRRVVRGAAAKSIACSLSVF